MVAGPEEQWRKLKAKYPNLYDDQILANKDGSKTLQAKRQDETGQVITYFYSTSPAACNSYQQNRLDAQQPAGMAGGPDASSNERYRFVGKDQDIVEDSSTGLQWMRCSLGQTWNGATCTGEAKEYTLDEAQRIAPAGWRLPTTEELASLVYCSSGKPAYWKPGSGGCKGAYGRPTIWSAAFPNTPASWFWSSSPLAGYAGFAWSVIFDSGRVGNSYEPAPLYVRLVRSGQAGDPGTSSPPRGSTEAAASRWFKGDLILPTSPGAPDEIEDVVKPTAPGGTKNDYNNGVIETSIKCDDEVPTSELGVAGL
jgi:hypothetical protein